MWIKQFSLAVESDEEEVPLLPPPLIHPALNTYHSNSVTPTTFDGNTTTTTVAISSNTAVAQRNATVARSSDMVTSTITTVARGRLGAITTTTGCPATVTVAMWVVSEKVLVSLHNSNIMMTFIMVIK